MTVEINGVPDGAMPSQPANKTNAAGGRRGGSRGGASRVRVSSRERQMAIQRQQRQAIAASPDMQALRGRMDDRSTDKTYRSGQVSVISSSASPPLYRNVNQLDERNTDRIYRDALVRSPTKQQIAQQAREAADPRRRGPRLRQHDYDAVPLPPLAVQNASMQGNVGQTQTSVAVSVEQLRAAVMVAASAIAQGQPAELRVDKSLLLRANTILDSLVTRQLLTEENRFAIGIVVLDAAAAPATTASQRLDRAFGKPEDLLRSQPAAKEAGPLDIAGFLNGDEAEEQIPEAPSVTVIDDEDNDELSPIADFLDTPAAPVAAPAAQVAQGPTAAPVAAAPVAKAPDSKEGRKRRK